MVTPSSVVITLGSIATKQGARVAQAHAQMSVGMGVGMGVGLRVGMDVGMGIGTGSRGVWEFVVRRRRVDDK